MQFADVKNDIAFRKIFGNETKKEILISFLNAVLKLEDTQKISWIEILNPYQLPRFTQSKASILDVRAKDENGNTYIIEMQVADKKGLDKRIIYYLSKGYAAQLGEGEDYHLLKPMIFIGILDFEFLQGTKYLSRHLILDEETQEHKLKDFTFHFIELPKFNFSENELKNRIEKWIFFIKNAPNLAIVPPNIDDVGLQEAYKEADKHAWTKSEVEEYEYAKIRETDEKTRELFLIESRDRQIGKNLIKLGSDDDFILSATGLSIAQIHELRKETNE